MKKLTLRYNSISWWIITFSLNVKLRNKFFQLVLLSCQDTVGAGDRSEWSPAYFQVEAWEAR